MELKQLPTLIWVTEPLPRCLATGEPLYVEEADLLLLGPEEVVYTLDLGHSSSGPWYGLLEDLEAILHEEGWSEEDVEAFGINDEQVAAGVCIDLSKGVMPWPVFQEQMARLREHAAEPPPPPEAVRTRPVLPEVWEAAVRVLAWVNDEAGVPVPAYLALVLDGRGLIRASDVKAGAPHDGPALADVILRATHADPDQKFREGRPQAVRVDDAELAAALTAALAGAAIPVRHEPTPSADEAVHEATRAMGRAEEVPYFSDYSEGEIRAYLKAARAFYRASPWERLKGNKYLGFQFGDGPWHYANVMGQLEEEPGLSLFDDWLQLCRFVHNGPTLLEAMMEEGDMKRLFAAGALEGMTLSPLHLLHPEDGAYLQALGVKPLHGGMFPLPIRYTPEGLAQPRFPLPVYQALMEGITAVLAKRRARTITSIKQTVDVAGTSLSLRYPARGDESAPETTGAFRIVVHGAEAEMSPGLLPPGRRIEIEAPGTATLAEVARAIDQHEKDRLWRLGFGSGDYFLWSDLQGRGGPSPRVADLKGLFALWMAMNGDRYAVDIMSRVGRPSSDTVTVSRA